MSGHSFSHSLAKQVATLGLVGYLPAPGTWGSAVGAALLLLLRVPDSLLLLCVAGGFIAGVVVSGVSEEAIGEKDSGHIIIDEVVGMAVSVLFLPQTAWYIAPAFVLFRVLDIFKPFPIRQIESRLKGGLGIMTDDLLAGIGANLVLQAWKTIF